MMEYTTLNYPVLALRGLTVFPELTLSFDVERELSLLALDKAMEADRRLLLVTQRDIATQEPREEDLFTVGTVSRIIQIIRTSENSVRVIVEGERRARIHRMWQVRPFLQANVELLEEEFPGKPTKRTEALLRQVYAAFGEYREIIGNVPDELAATVLDCREPGYLADLIAQNAALHYSSRQAVLEELHPVRRLQLLGDILAHEVEVLRIQSEIEDKVRSRVGQMQRDSILREQVHVLQHELGEDEDEEIDEYTRRVQECHLAEEVEKKLLREVDRLAKQPYASAEASVIRNYLDVCLDLPWNRFTKEWADVEKARKILDRDHFGLEKVKERILEYIAVRQLNPDAKGKILCLVGPPGVGKTSIALSVAAAMHRKLARLSLGGVRDEADIRGHRKTYIGAMPGRIIEGLTRAGAMNPLLVLDEIDKMASDMRGDPAAALLEVLDSEQNHAFRDHFLEIPVDLSRTMFITTANTTETIPRPLLDRMEVIELSSYTDEEKLEIARRHLLPKQLKEHALKKSQLQLTDGALRAVITDYTRESGVRQLERELGALCRKTALRLVTEDVKRVTVTEKDLHGFLGVAHYRDTQPERRMRIGVVNGLAWTEAGGELLEVEAITMPGTGKLELTGNLGNVMQESVKIAHSCLRSRCKELGIAENFYQTQDIHIHFPEGAVPKDGPSAGVTIATAMLSALTGRKVRYDVAMTGELTLRGRVLPIGGLKEKTMAALRNGMTTVIIPRENEKDLEEIDQTVRKCLRFVTAETVETVFDTAFAPPESESAVERMTVLTEEARREAGHGCQLQ